ncbi:hypothetical protein J6590_030434 [Homalodisca vitripennis]|nr:hypothetical protein J6590_030434 [Homalodisca vitripennis]
MLPYSRQLCPVLATMADSGRSSTVITFRSGWCWWSRNDVALLKTIVSCTGYHGGQWQVVHGHNIPLWSLSRAYVDIGSKSISRASCIRIFSSQTYNDGSKESRDRLFESSRVRYDGTGFRVSPVDTDNVFHSDKMAAATGGAAGAWLLSVIGRETPPQPRHAVITRVTASLPRWRTATVH